MRYQRTAEMVEVLMRWVSNVCSATISAVNDPRDAGTSGGRGRTSLKGKVRHVEF